MNPSRAAAAGPVATTTIRLSREGPIATIEMAREAIFNAFNEVMIEELITAFELFGGDSGVRVIVLRGAGKAFSAGADLDWMGRMRAYTLEENVADATRLAVLLRVISECPKAVVARVQGAALGGGTGLACACDIVVSSTEAVFGTTEVCFGLIPAVISPHVVRKVGPGNARYLFLTAEKIGAARAYELHLVNTLAPPEHLDRELDVVVRKFLLAAGPEAITRAKALLRDLPSVPYSDLPGWTARRIAEARVSPEGQEGIAAFFEKRRPVFHG